MDYKKNYRYFENKKLLLYVGAGLLILGVILWILPRSRDYGFIIYILSVLSILSGGVIFVVTLSMRANDKKIDESVETAFSRFEDETLERYDLYERQLHYVESAVIEGYKYFEGSFLRRDREGRYRTEIYAVTHVYFVEEGLCIGSREVSLIEDKQTDKSEDIPYSMVDRAYLTDDELIYKKGKKTIPVRYQTLHILKTDGSEFSAQAHSSQALDKLVSDINHIKERKAK